jgi:hypothetical protein
MDTTKLVVGQDVYMLKPPYPFWFCFDEGKVVKVTPEGVDVQVVDRQTANAAYCQRKERGDKAIKITPSRGKETDVGRRVEVQVADLQTADMIRFDTSGQETDVSRRDRLGFGPSPEDKFYTSLWQSAPEFGPWHLDDMPFAERTALLEQKAQRFRKWESMDCEHSKIGEHYYIEKCPICGCDNPNYNPNAAKDRLQGKLPK